MKIYFPLLNKILIRLTLVACTLILHIETSDAKNKQTQKRFTVLGLGDSITEGGDSFTCYLFPLWEKLFTAGYEFDFIGPNASKCRIGTLNCAGFGGKNAEYLAAHTDSIYRRYPADIVLIHSGHNHFDTEHPVAGIIAAQESMIKKIRAINPDVKIVVAQVILSGKLPKYSYLPELNKEIEKMVKRQKRDNVILVNQAKDFDWKKYTVADQVHPNALGGKKNGGSVVQRVKKTSCPLRNGICTRNCSL